MQTQVSTAPTRASAIGNLVKVTRVYGAITDRASTDRWAAAWPRPRSRASWAVRTAGPVGGRGRRRPIGRAGGTDTHATGPRGAAGPCSGDGRGVGGRTRRTQRPRLVGARVDGGLRGPAWASRAAQVRRCVRIWSFTDVWVMQATSRMGPRHVGHDSGSAVSVPGVGPSDLSDRYVTAFALR